MLGRSDRLVPVVIVLAAWAVAGDAMASSPGVPSLASTAADFKQYAETNLPSWFRTPLLNAADNSPEGNSDLDASVYNAQAELGRLLFYDGRLSHNDGTSCASCHVRENGFSDPNQFSVGFDGGLTGRHSMGLANARFYQNGRFFWDERAATLEEQTLGPIEDPVEMGSTILGPGGVLEELEATEFYPVLFERAFGAADPNADPNDTTDGNRAVITQQRMAAAMAQFVRSMVSYQSKFDQALEAQANGGALSDVLNAQEMQGHMIFSGACSRCHSGNAQIGANTPRNIGLNITEDEQGDPVPGVDQGAGDGRFKVPSLRNIAVREGFMHDGRFSTLEEVIEFYSSGILDDPNLSPGLSPGGFDFSQVEQDALIAFLNTLTDEIFLGTADGGDVLADLFTDPFVLLAGDFNDDGVVDTDDHLAIASEFGADEGPVLVDAAQYVLFRDNLGARWDDNQAGALPAAVTGAPEPAAIGLLVALTAPLVTRRPRRARSELFR